MFVRIDKKTLSEKIISSEEVVSVLEADLKAKIVDETLTDIVLGIYEHSNRMANYKYIAEVVNVR